VKGPASNSLNVLLTGGGGMLGRAVASAMTGQGHVVHAPGSKDYDLRDRGAVNALFASRKFDAVVHAAARVGGIQANIANPYAFLVDNLLINTNVIDAAVEAGVEDLMFIGSSCMYPKDYANPLREDYILEAPLEPTNEGYAISKIAGAKACEYLARERGLNYRTIIPSNLYGPNDAFDPGKSHLVAAAIAKTALAIKQGDTTIQIWGDGTARREFLFIDDLAGFIAQWIDKLRDLPQTLNVGAIEDHTVTEYYQVIAEALGYGGSFSYDTSKPVGMQRKLMDSSRAVALGWTPKTTLAEGVAITARHYLER
jgi:GDP-L-fucose synthase